MIPVVIVLAERQRQKVERLVKYCDQLDGTKIEVIEYGPERVANPYLATHLSFRKACKLFEKTEFFWLEADAIPLKAGWKQAITAEHIRSKRMFTLPDLAGLSRYDAASGIGIYPRRCRMIVPEAKPPMPYLAWDHWLYVKRRALIHFTKLIQHSYGDYASDGRLLRRHEFPKDQEMLRDDALIFHADPSQSLIPSSVGV